MSALELELLDDAAIAAADVAMLEAVVGELTDRVQSGALTDAARRELVAEGIARASALLQFLAEQS